MWFVIGYIFADTHHTFVWSRRITPPGRYFVLEFTCGWFCAKGYRLDRCISFWFNVHGFVDGLSIRRTRLWIQICNLFYAGINMCTCAAIFWYSEQTFPLFIRREKGKCVTSKGIRWTRLSIGWYNIRGYVNYFEDLVNPRNEDNHVEIYLCTGGCSHSHEDERRSGGTRCSSWEEYVSIWLFVYLFVCLFVIHTQNNTLK